MMIKFLAHGTGKAGAAAAYVLDKHDHKGEERAGVAGFERDRDDVTEAVESAEDRDRVTECLGTLTGLEYEAVTQAYYGGLTYRQVAERLGAKLATVKSRMRSALQRLQGCLGVGA